ncbi:MAG: ribose 5-phosphate isomerase B [Myxococcota bacterium]|nr:ribose 5-phosphate isomerase B [Myxococcota bacterium]
MRIAVASDHGGIALKGALVEWLSSQAASVTDFGPESTDSVDYPDYARPVAAAVAAGDADLGILVCGSGIGMSIAANKVAGVRAAVVQDEVHARLAREHNDANVLCLGGRFTATALAIDIVSAWLNAEFGGGRHARRVAKIEGVFSH